LCEPIQKCPEPVRTNWYAVLTQTRELCDYVLKYCEDAKNTCSKFQYAYTLDEERRLEHIFWSPTCCFDWYKKYGDVIVFDTTYKVNSYEMSFGIFVGMNNHGNTLLFGCALLRNETT
jgi:hypothetical protein